MLPVLKCGKLITVKNLSRTLLFLALLSNSQLFAQNKETKAYITDPMITTRCEILLEKRNEEVKVKQKAQALKERNKKLLDGIPPNKVRAKQKLEYTLLRLQQELRIINLKIENMTEDLVRKGCSGYRF